MSGAWLIGVHLLTAHTVGGLEAVTPGVYVQAPSGFTAGIVRNSFRDPSAYAGWTFQHGPIGVTVGAISGYERPLIPLVVPHLKVGWARFSFLPDHSPKAKIIGLHLSIEKEF